MRLDRAPGSRVLARRPPTSRARRVAVTSAGAPLPGVPPRSAMEGPAWCVPEVGAAAWWRAGAHDAAAESGRLALELCRLRTGLRGRRPPAPPPPSPA